MADVILSPDSPIIEIANRQKRLFDESQLLKAAAMILVDNQFERGEISIAIVNDPEMRALNKQYLNHDYETDVLSFVLDKDLQTRRLDGQLIVSADTAQRVADELEVSLDEELLLYVVHGMLHLVGLDDKNAAAADEMRKAEEMYLQRFGVSNHGNSIGTDDEN